MANILLTINERRKIYDGYKRETDGNERENLRSCILYRCRRSIHISKSLTTLDVPN